MISILIPVYNFDSSRLIRELHTQCSSLDIAFEIRVTDDASIPEIKVKNRTINSLTNIIYTELDQNIGRAAIRNKLANEAIYQYLLFIDCDAEIYSQNFIKRYIDGLQSNKILCGGVAYSTIKPAKTFCLRWYYGKKHETRPASERQKNEWQSFSFFNTIIDKKIFLSIQCNELIRKYGHEDTLFGSMLAKQSIHIKHIDNTLIHIGLNTNRSFILKTKEGIDSLYKLRQTTFDYQIDEYSRLMISIQKIKKMHLLNLFSSFYSLFGLRLEFILSMYPKQLKLFQFIKLCYLAQLYKQHK